MCTVLNDINAVHFLRMISNKQSSVGLRFTRENFIDCFWFFVYAGFFGIFLLYLAVKFPISKTK